MSGVDSDADTLAAGSRVGQIIAEKYRLERLLGRGGMGEVYEARHVVVGRRFALKLLHPHVAQGASAVARFMREARAAGSLESPHIAAVVDFATTADGVPFLVMEYLEGESLAWLLAVEGPLPVPRAVSLLLQICRGLEAAHGAGIVHRDLKPDNLFVVKQPDGSELLKILDFGIAKLVDEESSQLTHSGAVLGTPYYMAPEQARGEKQVDFRVDIYALGVIAFELLSAQRPHPGDGYNAILAHILTQPPESLTLLRPGLPEGLVTLIEAAMASDPAARPSSVAMWAASLAAFSGREIRVSGAQFDLRPSLGAEHPPLRTSAATFSAHEASGSTLQSAVGDVHSVATRSATGRRRWPLALLAAAGLGAFGLVKSRDTGRWEPETNASTTAAAASAPSASTAAPAVSSSAVSPSEAAPVTSPSAAPPSAPAAPPVASAPARAVSLPARPVAPAPRPRPSAERVASAAAALPAATSAAPPSASARQVKFDDNNPY